MADGNTDGQAAEAGRSRGGLRATGRRRRPVDRRRRLLKAGAWTAGAVFVLGGSGLGFAYFKLNGNISGVDIDAELGGNRPDDAPDGSMDILVLGSDNRSGANAKYGGAGQEGARSDTAMIVHVDKEHEKASVVSIPRDTIVDRPGCSQDGGGKAPAQKAMFNSAYQVGGPACAVKTVESMSGVRMDHYVEVDFDGFKKLIDTLGGVEVTTRKPINDKESHLALQPGRHKLSGEQSLGLVRTRHAVGDGSDLGRIQLQQAFVKALMDQVNDVGVFSSPKKLYNLADSATSAVTTDSELDSVTDLVGVAKLLKGVKSDDIQFSTLPVTYDPEDPNRVVPMESKARKMWAALERDAAIPASATKGSAGDRTDIGGVVR
ncbi:transcriptional regulator [Streptomyces daqingensis]|uniref:Transcriptional regulator n=1 Tax=Streptomyces daqingensis TaxID=1472640 RepID=A0ABQ2MCI5_9ACTN|nr:LCP family protein [Streptomyces daqingensis]GGO49569.1 transcriptional regulator [Streptomyces daqingensis]